MRVAPRRSNRLPAAGVRGAAVVRLLAGYRPLADEEQSVASGALAGNVDQVANRARLGLKKILLAIEERPRSAQTKRLVRIVADIYEGDEFRVDLKDLKALN